MIAALISFTANLRLRRKSHKQILGVLFPFFISLQHPHEKKNMMIKQNINQLMFSLSQRAYYDIIYSSPLNHHHNFSRRRRSQSRQRQIFTAFFPNIFLRHFQLCQITKSKKYFFFSYCIVLTLYIIFFVFKSNVFHVHKYNSNEHTNAPKEEIGIERKKRIN